MYVSASIFLFLTLTQWAFFPDSKSKQPKATAPQRNKFEEVKSPMMPHSLPVWSDASSRVGLTFDHSQKSRHGVPRGYFLPDPALFAHHQDPNSCQSYLHTYLKLHDILFYQLTTCGAAAYMLNPPDWRRLLSLELHGTKTESHEALQRKKLCDQINESAVQMGGSFVSNISSASPCMH